MARRQLTIEQILAILEETPGRLRALTSEASESQLHAAAGPGEWSVVEVLAHLRSCADVWGDAIERILVSARPLIRAVNPTTWIESTDYRRLAFGPSLQALTGQRARLLTRLGTLPNASWSRSATVLGAGRPLQVTVHSYADRLARHEHTHWRQVEQTVRSIPG